MHSLVAQPTMSKKGDCHANAAMESWNHSLKVEAVHGGRFITRDAARTPVFKFGVSGIVGQDQTECMVTERTSARCATCACSCPKCFKTATSATFPCKYE